ncbi:L,D-transpeptidase [Microbacterium marinilacus]|uniref:L,D-TPase catalytic domain-containing protein n=1 Tax=Microbacterium marinilacus TaxID=415209 RepID=A0ABP7B1T0_9MICO|nr:L,D-transpeptidase [Microbacterium marinilacus]MBY0688764.1 L,D-transpeptidase [Microbacterium marinilacus]
MNGGTGLSRRALPRVALVVGAAVLVAVAAWAAVALLAPPSDAQAGPARAVGAQTPAAAPTPTPTPTPTGFPENTRAYDLSGLPAVDVFAVVPELPVDDEPFAALEPLLAQPAAAAAPVFADPRGEPVAQLPQTQTYGGTVVPVVERQDHWVRVLLAGRQGLPGDGDPSQLSGWIRVSDVTLSAATQRVEVDISDRTVRIVTEGGDEELIADDLAWGTAETPTPLGRSFLMFTDVVEEFAYTRGNPLVYLSVQSPTLAGFGGQSVAVTAFHYHDQRSGPISNGCLRVPAEATARLADLPPGTPVYISE